MCQHPQLGEGPFQPSPNLARWASEPPSPASGRGHIDDHRARGSEFDALVGAGSFSTTLPDLARYEQALRQYRLINEASTLAMFNGVPTGDGNTRYGLGWFIGSYNGMALADHEGAWNGFRSYICLCLDVPLSIFMLTNHPDVNLLELANLATDVFAGE